MARSNYRFPVPRLDSIRSRILALSILGTIVPTALALGIAYRQNRRALESQVTQNLLSASSGAARAAGVWLKERLYDLRVFASSDEVLNNVNRYATGSADRRINSGTTIAAVPATGDSGNHTVLRVHTTYALL